MKKSRFIWMCALLLLAFGMSSCSSDNDSDDDKALSGTWYMESASYGFEGGEKFKTGDIIIIFNGNRTLAVNNNISKHFLGSGTYNYRIMIEKRKIYTYEQKSVEVPTIAIQIPTTEFGTHEIKYDYYFREGMLILDGGMARDGPGFFFRR